MIEQPKLTDFSRLGQIKHATDMIDFLCRLPPEPDQPFSIALGQVDWVEELHRLLYESD